MATMHATKGVHWSVQALAFLGFVALSVYGVIVCVTHMSPVVDSFTQAATDGITHLERPYLRLVR